MLDLQPIKGRLAAASPGRWYREVTGVAHGGSRTEKTWLFADDGATEADAELVAHCKEDLAALVAEVERLRAQVVELVDPENAELVSFVDGAFAFHSEVFRTLLAGLVMMLDKAGAENYCQIDIAAGTRDAVVLTIQRKAGKTPHDLRREAEAEVERLRGAIKAHHASLDTEDGLLDDSDRKLWAVLDA